MSRSSSSSGRSVPPTPRDLPAFLVYAFKQYQPNYTVKVVVSYIEENQNRRKSQQSIAKIKLTGDSDKCDNGTSNTSTQTDFEKKVQEIVVIDIILLLDRREKLVDLTILRCDCVPRILFKIIALCIPFHPTLNRLACRYSPLEDPCFYELCKCLYHVEARVTEIILDDSPVRGCSYHLILEQTSNLRVLSLARCGLDDDDIVKLAELLKYPEPASFTLNMLNLSTNSIGDTGACALADALRTNRALQYLNLFGNHITSDGSIPIFVTLIQFPLTYEEVLDKRMKTMNHLCRKRRIYEECLANLTSGKCEDCYSKKSPRRRTTQIKGESSNTMFELGVQEKAQLMAADMVGEIRHPFANDQITIEQGDRKTYSLGNTTLCYLSLAYNNLDYTSLLVLVEVMIQQSSMTKKGPGLLKVQIEGNDLPDRCEEYNVLRELFDKTVASRCSKTSVKSKMKATSAQSMARKSIPIY